MTSDIEKSAAQNKGGLAITLGALGVVFGDIGTSPLYAFELVFSNPLYAVSVTRDNVLGILSLFFWSLVLVVTVKYVLFIMRFDNKGEGGIVALMTLLLNKLPKGSVLRRFYVPLGLIGAALFYGDGVITPAISVLSAVEGLETISPALSQYVVPVSLVVLLTLFICQRQGTERISKFFGPVMLVWFIVIAVLGLGKILDHPEVLTAINPFYALTFLANHGTLSFIVLGSVVLCLTGAEALYADMGHFGARPIQRAWILLVFPALVLNYFGQGALLLDDPTATHNPFFRLAPDWALHALVGLATIATVVASQAVISGVFSMTQQLVQLRFLPRLNILHTSVYQTGQIYVPMANWLMAALVVLLVVVFQSSNALGAAYGIAVTGTMLVTDFFAIAVVIHVWRWSRLRAVAGALIFIIVDTLFFSANALKIISGGWFPVALSIVVLLVMATWQRGVKSMTQQEQKLMHGLDDFLHDIESGDYRRSKATSVFLSSDPAVAPSGLVFLANEFQTVAQRVILLNIDIQETPFVRDPGRFCVTDVGQGVYVARFTYGYRDPLDVPGALAQVFPGNDTFNQYHYFANRYVLEASKGDHWSVWRKRLFIFMFRNVVPPYRLFRMPAERVVEFGRRMVL